MPGPTGEAAPNLSASRAAAAAYVAAAVNLVAGAAMLVVLRTGLPAGESRLVSRMAHVRGHVAAWRAGWLVWHLAAITLLGLFVALALRWRNRAPLLTSLALMVAAAGLAADLAAEAIFITVLPHLGTADYKTVEAVAVALTGYLGNGLYTVAGILLTWAGRRELRPSLVWLAVIVWGSGLWLSAATAAGSATGEFASSALLVPAFVTWAALVGRWLSTRTD